MSQQDPFSQFTPGLEAPASRHFTITPSDADLPVRPRFIYCEEPGPVIIRDELGIDHQYDLKGGQILPFRAVRVMEAPAVTDQGVAPPVLVGWV